MADEELHPSRRRPARGALTIGATFPRLGAVALAALTTAWGAPARAALDGEWSAPAPVSGCASVGAPALVFPSDRPGHATGPGALVWAASDRCAGGAGARVQSIGPVEQLAPPSPPRTRRGASIAPLGPLSATGAPHGEVLIAGVRASRDDQAMLVQGPAGGPFVDQALPAAAAPPAALTSAYLGDLAAAFTATPSLDPTATLLVEVERYYAHRLGVAVPIAAGAGAARTLTTAMDFRGETLVAWAQGGEVLACRLSNGGVRGAVQQLGPAGTQTHLAALLSDDRRGIVMWAAQLGSSTSIYLDYSAPGPRFGPARLLERFTDPGGRPLPAGSPRLVRLSSEGVLSAWSSAAGSDWVVRAAPIDEHGMRQVTTLTAPGGGDALLSALAAGPHAEAVILFSAPATGLDAPLAGVQTDLFATRVIDLAPGVTRPSKPVLISAPGPVSGATVAIDPDDARPLAAWRGSGGSVFYVVGPSPPAS